MHTTFLSRRFRRNCTAAVLLAGLVLTGCSKKPDDQAIAKDVEQRLSQDPKLKATDIHAVSNNGAVILTGNVVSDAQKMEAANVASQVNGVRQVIVSLEREPVATAATTTAPSASTQPVEPTPQPTTSPAPSSPGAVAPPLVPASITTHTWTDPIDQYLASKPNTHNYSPMVGRGSVFESDGAEYTIDPRLIVAISGAETSFATGKCHKTPVVDTRNAWNWFWCYGNNSCGTDVCDNSTFDTWDSGIKTLSKYVKRNYIMKGLTDVRKIQVKYCTEGCDYWVKNVQTFMQQMGGDPENLTVARPFPGH